MGILSPFKALSQRTLFLLIAFGVFTLLGLFVFFYSYTGAQKAREQIIQNKETQINRSSVAITRQVKRVKVKRLTADGIRYFEFHINGVVNVYDENMKLIKTGIQGFYRIDMLFEDVNLNLDDWLANGGGFGQETEIETSTGTYIIGGGDGPSPTPGGGGLDEVVDDLIDNTFNPTPAPAPTLTLAPGQPSPTTGPNPTNTPRPPSPTGQPQPSSSPTPVPEYMTAPPFSCEDYDATKPITISNVVCTPN